jgi:solute carrier family 25 oxoglutarate transporter 11
LSHIPCFQFAIAARLTREQGFGSLYSGLSAGLLRQATYTTARLGIYNNLYNFALTSNENKVSILRGAAP